MRLTLHVGMPGARATHRDDLGRDDCGMLPSALGIGLDIVFHKPMAMAVIGGLISSTALSLLFMPVIFSDTRGLEDRVMARMRRRAERDGYHDALPEQA